MSWTLGSYGFWVGLGLPFVATCLVLYPAPAAIGKTVGFGFLLGLAAGLAGTAAGLVLLHVYGGR